MEVDDPETALKLIALGYDGDSVKGWPGFREAHECEPTVKRQPANDAWQCGHRVHLAGMGISYVQTATPRVEEEDPAAFEPGRVWQGETSNHDLSARDFDETATGCLHLTPALRGVRLPEGGDVARLAVRQGQSVQMAAILGA
jgi:hypothetical protein